MTEGKYFFNGKDIAMNICIQIRDVVDIIQDTTGMNFPDAMAAFYHSKTYKALQNTENMLWAVSAGQNQSQQLSGVHVSRSDWLIARENRERRQKSGRWFLTPFCVVRMENDSGSAGLDLRIAEKNKEIGSYQEFRMRFYESLEQDIFCRPVSM